MALYTAGAEITTNGTNGGAVYGGDGRLLYETTIGGKRHSVEINSKSVGKDNILVTDTGGELTVIEGWFDIEENASATPGFHPLNTPSDVLYDNDSFEADAHNNASVQFAQGHATLKVENAGHGGEDATYIIDWDAHKLPLDFHREGSGSSQTAALECQGINSVIGLYQTNI